MAAVAKGGAASGLQQLTSLDLTQQQATLVLDLLRKHLPPQPHVFRKYLPPDYSRNGQLVLDPILIRKMISEMGEQVEEKKLGSVDGIVNLQLCLSLAQLVASLGPDLRSLKMEGGFPEEISREGCEQAMGVLFAALAAQGPSAVLSDLMLFDAKVYGTERVCRHLAHLLTSDHCKLEELYLWGTGMRAEGMRHIAEALHTDSTLKRLVVSSIPDVGDTGVEHLLAMLPNNATLENLHLKGIGMTGNGTRRLFDALSSPAARLKRLYLANIIDYRGPISVARELGGMLAHNRSLERLYVENDDSDAEEKGMDKDMDVDDEEGHVAQGLRSNSTLQSFRTQDKFLGQRGMEWLFNCLATVDSSHSLRELQIQFRRISKVGGRVQMPGPQHLALMLSSNRSLRQLSVPCARYSADDWATVILPALAANQGLEIVVCQRCPGFEGDKVLDALMHVVRTNTVLETFYLGGTPVDEAGYAEAVEKELRLNKETRKDNLPDMDTVYEEHDGPTFSTSICAPAASEIVGSLRPDVVVSRHVDLTQQQATLVLDLFKHLPPQPHVFYEYLPPDYNGNEQLVLDPILIRKMISEMGKQVKKRKLGSVDGIVNLQLCLSLAQLVASLPHLRSLKMQGGFPEEISREGCEQAMGVLFAALAAFSAVLFELELMDDEVFGTERVCRHLAHLLTSKHCKLEWLYLFDTGMRAEGLRHIAEALHTNSTLKRLDVFSSPDVGDAGVEHLSAMLPSNATLESLRLNGFRMTGNGTRRLFDALSSPAARLKDLHLANIIDYRGPTSVARELGGMLAHNRSLERLYVENDDSDAKEKGMDKDMDVDDEEGHVAQGLRSNSTLQSFGTQDKFLGQRGMERLFNCLATVDNTHSLQDLQIQFSSESEVEMPGPQHLALMLSLNRSLQQLSVPCARYSADDWATVILPALAANQGLKIFFCQRCPGFEGDKVLDALMHIVRTNTVLETFHLGGTPVDEAGYAEAVQEELRLNEEFRAALASVPSSKPKSCRIVLCGKEYAGKSRIFQTLKRVVNPLPGCLDIASHYLRKKIKLPLDPYDKELTKRTRGINIHILKDVDEFRLSTWDFAGHREFHALHDFMFPRGNNGTTMFVFTFSPIMSPTDSKPGDIKTYEHLEEELLYWLKFIVSNTKPHISHKPFVVVVITRKDLLDMKLGGHVNEWVVGINNAISSLAAEFKDLVTMSSEGHFVNALDTKDVGTLLVQIEGLFRQRLEELPHEPEICQMVAKALEDPQLGDTPIITTQAFQHICKKAAGDDESLETFLGVGERGWRAIAAYLHSAGEVIYHEELDFIVRNPRWFGLGILGHLIDIFSDEGSQEGRLHRHNLFKCCFKKGDLSPNNYLPKNGFINGGDLKNLLKKAAESIPGIDTTTAVHPEDLVKLMKLLNLCFEQTPGDPHTGYLLPAIFEDGRDQQAANGKRKINKWPDWKATTFFGRRLECADPHHTFLTAGFFPRLQVVLHNVAVERNWASMCRLDKYLFIISVNGMEIVVEYSGFAGYFVDILVKSSQPHQESLEFVHSNIITVMRTFCASRRGCQGVRLVEAIIRPECVTSLTLCAYRRDQAITLDVLSKEMTRYSHYKHSWGQVEDEHGNVILAASVDAAQSLLEGASTFTTVGAAAVSGDDTSCPRHIVVQACSALSARIRIGRVVPLKLHLKCEDSAGEHEVQQQPGRTFYLVDKVFAIDKKIRTSVVGVTAAALKVGGTVVPGMGVAGGVLGSVLMYQETPVYPETIEYLSGRMPTTSSAAVSNDQLRLKVEEDLQGSIAGPWMKAFVKPDESQSFLRDFMLRKVVYNSTSSTAWLCDTHYAQGQDTGILQKVL